MFAVRHKIRPQRPRDWVYFTYREQLLLSSSALSNEIAVPSADLLLFTASRTRVCLRIAPNLVFFCTYTLYIYIYNRWEPESFAPPTSCLVVETTIKIDIWGVQGKFEANWVWYGQVWIREHRNNHSEPKYNNILAVFNPIEKTPITQRIYDCLGIYQEHYFKFCTFLFVKGCNLTSKITHYLSYLKRRVLWSYNFVSNWLYLITAPFEAKFSSDKFYYYQ